MENETRKNLPLAITMSVTAYIIASMVIITPEKMGLLQGIFFSSAYKAMLSQQTNIGGLYSFMGKINLVCAAALVILYYKNHRNYLKIILGIFAISASFKWGIEYFSFRGMLAQESNDYSIKYYAMIIFSIALCTLFGLFLEEEETDDSTTANTETTSKIE